LPPLFRLKSRSDTGQLQVIRRCRSRRGSPVSIGKHAQQCPRRSRLTGRSDGVRRDGVTICGHRAVRGQFSELAGARNGARLARTTRFAEPFFRVSVVRTGARRTRSWVDATWCFTRAREYQIVATAAPGTALFRTSHGIEHPTYVSGSRVWEGEHPLGRLDRPCGAPSGAFFPNAWLTCAIVDRGVGNDSVNGVPAG
jgi:hypothetical protein